ncbi:uncharacterized protein DS421_7g207450 [Arachis hypogaea]|nr:uncharacterized protein DS421_7g207450 [Arachis hypogaea]
MGSSISQIHTTPTIRKVIPTHAFYPSFFFLLCHQNFPYMKFTQSFNNFILDTLA